MAKNTTKKTIETATISKIQNGENKIVEKSTTSKLETVTSQTVIFKKSVRGSYGAFDCGRIYKIDGKQADLFIKNGVCEKC